ncbi:MAG: dihydroorotate dehydrogenase electron transfer subunit [Deltaproteobacteria bacterium]|nr:dihydroorotate dehydrogenase electron transfer subunit [Deltaproteobacteria bacterium]
MQNSEVKIIHNKEVAPGYFLLGLSWTPKRVRPGQFVMLRVSDGLDPLLRRPFGIYRVMPGQRGVELLYQVVGKGTRILAAKRPGESLGVLGPLGNGFPKPGKGKKIIMAAGGMGIVPLYPLINELKDGLLLFGARGKAGTKVIKDFKKLKCRIRIATEDGSAGQAGLVTDLLREEVTPDAVVYACGPPGMLKAVSVIAEQADAPCWVSLERSMACGIGVCLGCAVKTRTHEEEAENRLYKMVCSDGPVFSSGDMDWDAI